MLVAMVGAIVALAVVAFILQPLTSRGRWIFSTLGSPDYERLREQRELAIDALRELDVDLELGKLTEADYRRLYERYRRDAVAAMKAADEREASLSRRLEQEVALARQSLVAGVQRAAEPAPAPLPRPAPPARPVHLRRSTIWFSGACAIFLMFAAAVLAYYLTQMRASSSIAWVSTLPTNAAGMLVADANQPGRLLAVSSGAMMESTDDGRTWAPTGGPANVSALARDADGRTLYALADGTVERSHDGGATWTKASAQGPKLTAIAADPLNSHALFGVDPNGTVWKSSDAASSWQQEGASAGRLFGSLAVGSSSPLVLFGSQEGAGVLVDMDGKWGSGNGVLNGALPTDNVHYVLFDPSTGETASMPNGRKLEGSLYAATDQGVFKSLDYGTSWVRLGLHVDVDSLAVGPPGSKLMLAVDNAGHIYRSNDRGVTWSAG